MEAIVSILQEWTTKIFDLPLEKVMFIWVPPFIAFVYAISSALFLPFFRECPWTTHLSPVVLRISLMVGFLAVAIPFDEKGNFVLLGVICFTLSGYLLVQTRIHVVEGGSAPTLSRMERKVVLITGANTGIGKETAIQLGLKGAQLILACRSAGKAESAKNDIVDYLLKHKPEDPVEPVDILLMDLSSLASVKKAVTELEKKKIKVDVLILNAGVMMGTQVMTEDGYELVMQANHLGHYLLTRLLLDRGMLNTNNGRVLVVTSSTYSFAKSIDLKDLFCTKGRKYTLFGQYEMSKLANILFVKELDRRFPNLFTAAVHPGLVRTDVVRNMQWYLYYPNIVFAFALQTLQKTPEQGAWCTSYLAAPIKDLVSGEYWVNRNTQELWPCAQDMEGASLLWKDSAKYVGIDP